MLFAEGDSGKPVGGPDGGSGTPKKKNIYIYIIIIIKFKNIVVIRLIQK